MAYNVNRSMLRSIINWTVKILLATFHAGNPNFRTLYLCNRLFTFLMSYNFYRHRHFLVGHLVLIIGIIVVHTVHMPQINRHDLIYITYICSCMGIVNTCFWIHVVGSEANQLKWLCGLKWRQFPRDVIAAVPGSNPQNFHYSHPLIQADVRRCN